MAQNTMMASTPTMAMIVMVDFFILQKYFLCLEMIK
jgi:hypothetical protein